MPPKGKKQGKGPKQRSQLGQAVERAAEASASDPGLLVTSLEKAVRGALPTGATGVGSIDVAQIVRTAATAMAPSVGQTPEAIHQALQEQGMDYVEPFAPGRPLNPYFGYGQRPRSWNYQVGRNISTRPRQYRVPFETLGNLIQSYDVAQVCIRHVIDDLRSMPLLFGPKPGVEEDVNDEIQKAMEFLADPTGDGETSWPEFLGMWGQDIFRYDGGALYKRRDVSGRLIGMEVVDTRTMAPLIDYMGRRPEAPAPAFLQFIQGLPWDWVTRNDFVYTRMNPLPEDVYGLAPIEAVLMTANSDLRYQWYWLQYFTEGTVPEGFMQAPPEANNPDALEEWQETWENWLMGDQSQKVKVRWVPAGSKYEAAKQPAFDKNFPIWLMRHTVAAYGLTPQDLGWTDDVNRATGETQMDVQFRIGSMPKTIMIGAILNRLIQKDLGLRVAVRFDTGREKEDRLQEAQAMAQYVEMGAISPDEVRSDILGYKVQADEMTPRFIMSERLGPIPLSYLISVGGVVDRQTGAPEPGSVVPSQFVLSGNQAPDPMSTPEEQRLMAIAQHSAHSPDRALALPPELRTSAGQQEAAELAAEDELSIRNPGEHGTVESGLPPGQGQPGQRAPQNKPNKAKKGTSSAGAAKAAATSAPKAPMKKEQAVVAAGVALRAADTGRVLMLQRSMADESDPQAGTWEFPGGKLDAGEEPREAALREFAEEVGAPLPAGAVEVDSWTSPNGVYEGFVYEVESEAAVQPNMQEGRALNPDDPDGDDIEVCCWWEPQDASKLPNLRTEVRLTPWHTVSGPGDLAKGYDFAAMGHAVRLWRKAARDQVRGRRRPRIYVHEAIPPEVTEHIWSRLEGARSREQVDLAFSLDKELEPAEVSPATVRLPKPEARYRKASFPTICCRTCAHMVADGTCTMVEGRVAPDFLCDFFSYEGQVTAPARGPGQLDAVPGGALSAAEPH